MAAAVDRLERTVRELGRRAASLAGVAADLLEDLKVVRQTLREDPSGELATTVELAILRAREERRRRARRAASVGARTFEVKPCGAGAMRVHIDGSEWFRLSRGDARILLILAKASLAPDGFPIWWTYEQLADEVERKVGTRPTRRAIVEAVYRVRKAFDAADLNPHFLKSEPKAGRIRFLLRVGSGGAGGPGTRVGSSEAARVDVAG